MPITKSPRTLKNQQGKTCLNAEDHGAKFGAIWHPRMISCASMELNNESCSVRTESQFRFFRFLGANMGI
ncbi:hypothetical protein I312_101401 [Cryptococcus bacillisporus CA1280]|uniref:uncharacterized protein n=1 Tax=Cryptococcus bacillisporus CA1280 TaxID=1296109 RepID=UPI0033672440